MNSVVQEWFDAHKQALPKYAHAVIAEKLEGKSVADVDALKAVPQKSPTVAFWLAFLLGFVGAHRFYMNRWESACWYLLTCGWFGIGVLRDLFVTVGYVKMDNYAKLIPYL